MFGVCFIFVFLLLLVLFPFSFPFVCVLRCVVCLFVCLLACLLASVSVDCAERLAADAVGGGVHIVCSRCVVHAFGVHFLGRRVFIFIRFVLCVCWCCSSLRCVLDVLFWLQVPSSLIGRGVECVRVEYGVVVVVFCVAINCVRSEECCVVRAWVVFVVVV